MPLALRSYHRIGQLASRFGNPSRNAGARLGAHHVDGAREARVKRMHNPQHFDGLIHILHRSAQERLLQRTALPEVIERRGVPAGGRDYLVTGNLALGDLQPMAEGPAWGFGHLIAAAGIQWALQLRAVMGRFLSTLDATCD